MHRIIKSFIFISSIFLIIEVSAFSDQIILKNGKRIKGYILNEYKDRIVVSTPSGEKYFMKSDLRSASYDDEARALMQKARNQVKKREYVKAYYTYEEALAMDPTLEEAMERRGFLKRYLENKHLEDMVQKLNKRQKYLYGKEGLSILDGIVEELGVSLAQGDKYVYVSSIDNRYKPAPKAGVQEGDRIISIWGEMSAYMDIEEVAGLLLGSFESKFVLERDIDVYASSLGIFRFLYLNRYDRIIGAKIGLEKKGYVITKIFKGGPFDKAGIEEGDVLYKINGQNTTYMPFKDIINILKNLQGKEIKVTVRRTVTIWAKEEIL